MGTGGVRVSRRKGETRASPGGEPSMEDRTETVRPSEALPEESEARGCQSKAQATLKGKRGHLRSQRDFMLGGPPSLFTHVSGAPAPPAPVLCSLPWGAQPKRHEGGGVRARNRTRPTWCCQGGALPPVPFVFPLCCRLQLPFAVRAPSRRRHSSLTGHRDSECPYRQGGGARLTDRSAARHLPAGDQMLLTPGTESQPRSPSVFVHSGDDAGLQMALSSPL
ncbi:hypothetical protein NDU88_004577 [Pleurodeles waltl]|uniref:Uncharacterized protein n=1 Tax=Pleurodeles waltl TaxID=8319 RepID=A0AAV7WSD0_PLEWA|nr:hypothetical protein NDU88_004577 [Pleurodeles waltl]